MGHETSKGRKLKDRKPKGRKLKIRGFIMLLEEEDGRRSHATISERALRDMIGHVSELKGKTIKWNTDNNKITIP